MTAPSHTDQDSPFEYVVCESCGDTYAAAPGVATSCPSCDRRSEKPQTDIPSSPSVAPRRPTANPSQRWFPLPTWLRNTIAISATGLLLLFLFASSDTKAPPVPDNYVPVSEADSRAASAAFDVLGVLIIGIPIYFLPSLIAHWMSHRNKGAVILTNLLFGWTGIGWGVALIWACMATQHGAPRSASGISD